MSRSSLPFLLTASLLFVVAGVIMTATGTEGGLLATLFFGVCAAVFVWQLWPSLLERKQPPVDQLLAGYPLPVELRGSPIKFVFLAIIITIFGGVVLWMLLHEPLGWWMKILLWPCAVLFLAGSPFLVYLAVSKVSLRLTVDGFDVAHAWRHYSTRWRDVSEFEPYTTGGNTLICYDDARAGASRVVSMNRKLTGRSSALPDTYGLMPDDLTALMNAWRERSLP